MSSFPWLTTLIVLPLLGAAVLWALPRPVARGELVYGPGVPAPGPRRTREVALGFALVELVLTALAVVAFDTSDAGTVQLTETHSWIPAFGVSYALGVNGVGLVLVAMSALLVPLVVLAAWREQGSAAQASDRLRQYLALVLLLQAFIVAVFAARDLFFFYLVFEAMLIPVYFMIGGFGGRDGARRRYAAVKFLLYSLAGGLIMLIGVIVLYLHGPGGADGFLIDKLTGVALDPTIEKWLFVSFFVAFAIKAPMFPVHTWLPDAAEQAPAGTSTLLVGVLDKVGTFGMLTLCLPLFPNASRWVAPVIIVLAVVSILYGALLAIGQQDLFRMVAYTSVSHSGFIVLGIFAFTSTSISGSSFYMVNDGFSTGALFLLVGFLAARRGSARIDAFGGLQRAVPVLAGLFLVVGLSALALPGLSPFVSEILVLVGSFATQPVAAVVATLGVVLAALYILWLYQRAFTGPVTAGVETLPDASARERWVVGPLVAVMLVLGFVPGPALNLVREPAQVTIDQVGATDAPAVAEASAQ
ncbi:MAG: NADH-quinone oxidoreductase subunit M [Cellulomonas sp. 73-92]|uniref:NADH-quinone oxidoreductase subunit M n=1 Tax=Cellulomonas sp. 73-92 TaxID=1895740 RepID=UPI00092A9D29|nr:NADH-quinone oxidoreductase subunit M [Cellulomonas sp. 73-92]OJV75987.1 MAG: NADH-quinone oxidoreductase subunit M [Cellulomonas sp. 73-92]